MAKEMGQRLRLIALLQQLVSQTSKPTDDHDRGQSRVIQVMSENTDNSFMRRAIAVAIMNPQHPFGAVIVDNTSEVIVAEGVNQSGRNPILHGEMDAINNYATSGGTDWRRLTLYTTAEPCPMCMSAILWSGISSVVYGTSIPTLMQMGWNQIDIRATEVVGRSHRTNCEVIPSVLVRECDALFRNASCDGKITKRQDHKGTGIICRFSGRFRLHAACCFVFLWLRLIL